MVRSTGVLRGRVGRAAALCCAASLWAVDVAAQQTKMPPPSGRRPVETRVERFERTERVAKLRPEEVIAALGVQPGEVVADIGAGSGLFARPFARAVGPEGKVLAIDISADIMGYLRERAKDEGLINLEVIVSKPDDPLLPPDSVDLAFFCDTVHHIENRVPFFQTMRKGLKDGARVAVIDYPTEASEKGWSGHAPEELVPALQVKEEMDAAGFRFVKEMDILPQNYLLLFEKLPDSEP